MRRSMETERTVEEYKAHVHVFVMLASQHTALSWFDQTVTEAEGCSATQSAGAVNYMVKRERHPCTGVCKSFYTSV
jgi:hypothetical protein